MPIELKVPSVGESITEVEIGDWLKTEGDAVQKDENIVALESEKATVELPAPAAGKLSKILKRKGEKAAIGDVIGHLEVGGATTETKPTAAPNAQPAKIEPSPSKVEPPKLITEAPKEKTEVVKKAESTPGREVEVVRMTPLRRAVARRLVEAQNTMAMLTTFNELDMSRVIALRKEHQESFTQKHGVKLGFMSFFVKATIEALKAIPQLNASVQDEDIVYHNYFDIGIAIGAGKGLVVPVLRNAERLSFAELEKAIAEFAKRAQENKLKPDELQGGTFTITNGGVYGSLLSTPIVNPPQSGILGMHTIQERPIAVEGQVVIRPMMYAALSYDHRIVDGREAVTFLKRLKEAIEDPAQMLLEI